MFAQTFLLFRNLSFALPKIIFISTSDVAKVLSVVRNQMERGMAEDADSVEQLDELLRKKYSYFGMQKIWKREETEEEEEELTAEYLKSVKPPYCSKQPAYF